MGLWLTQKGFSYVLNHAKDRHTVPNGEEVMDQKVSLGKVSSVSLPFWNGFLQTCASNFTSRERGQGAAEKVTGSNELHYWLPDSSDSLSSLHHHENGELVFQPELLRIVP